MPYAWSVVFDVDVGNGAASFIYDPGLYEVTAMIQLRALPRNSTDRKRFVRSRSCAEQTARLLELMNQNNELTELTKELSERIETLTKELPQR